MPDTVKQSLDILKYLSSNKRYTAFPNYFVALRIFLTIPITVVSGERSFSCLELIKNYLKSTMLQDRLNHLAIIAIERDLSRKQDFDTILHYEDDLVPNISMYGYILRCTVQLYGAVFVLWIIMKEMILQIIFAISLS